LLKSFAQTATLAANLDSFVHANRSDKAYVS
jgi:hypothetical protein